MPQEQVNLIDEFAYAGSELDLFSNATNWKKYWFSIIEPLLGLSVLEVGAGIGSTSKLFAASRVEKWMAIEPDVNLARRIKNDCIHSKYPANFEIQSISSKNLSTEFKFDTILYIDVLEHIQNDQYELEYISKLLKPGGRIIILSPAHNYLFSPFDYSIGHYRRYNKKSLSSIKPKHMIIENIIYLDSVGMLASLGNKFFLKSTKPSVNQIKVWDKYFVPSSRVLDKITMNTVGKSIIGVFKFD